MVVENELKYHEYTFLCYFTLEKFYKCL